MVKADLVRRVIEATTLDSPAAQKAVNALFESATTALARGDRVVFRGFGLCSAHQRGCGIQVIPARQGWNSARSGSRTPPVRARSHPNV